jgi:ferric-dicitrate binding protein FerR (iron transport regulator)
MKTSSYWRFSASEKRSSLNRDAVGDLSRRLVLIGGGAWATQCAGLIAAQAAAAVGRVGFSQGDAFLDRDGDRVAANEGVDIFRQDVAMTGDEPSRVDLRLGAATRIRLGAKARLEISRIVPGVAASATLRDGSALIERGPGAEPDFQLKSPFALIAARGTTFFAGPSNGVFGVFVREGLVVVRTRRGAVTLQAGEGTDIKAPGMAPTPVKRWGEARIAAALASVQ